LHRGSEPRFKRWPLVYSQALREEFRLGPASTVQKAFRSPDASDILDRYKGDYFFLDALFLLGIKHRTG